MASILVKFPTRARPEKFFSTLEKYRSMESGKHSVKYVVTCDLNDPAMNNPQSIARLEGYDGLKFRFGPSTTKIQAVNADMDLASDDWEILVLASDDMIPKVQGWDNIVASEIQGRDAVWFYDGRTDAVCTLSIMSRKKYLEQGYIYHPDYTSLWCDNEWTETAKPKFVGQVVIQHVWWSREERDALLFRNESYYNADKVVYEKRKAAGFPKGSVFPGDPDDWLDAPRDHPLLSIMICSLKSRAALLEKMTKSLDGQITAIGAQHLVEVLTEVDERKMSIGEKRNILMQRAQGDYVCFVDDDDEVSDDYVWLMALACSKGKDCVGLTGKILANRGWKKFVISLKYDSWRTTSEAYCRTPNHVTPIRREIALKYPFPKISFGEDVAYSKKMAMDKALKSEEFVESCVYYYTPSGSTGKRAPRHVEEKIDPREIEPSPGSKPAEIPARYANAALARKKHQP